MSENISDGSEQNKKGEKNRLYICYTWEVIR